MRIDIISVVPELLESPLGHSIIGRAIKKGLVEIHVHNLREHGKGPRLQVDDYCYGGDAGMVLVGVAMVLAIFNIGSLLRQTRGSMMEVFQEDYIRTARAKGLGEFIVVMGHALRNALIPVVTVLSTMIPFLFGGAVVAEQVFGWPGLGSLMVQSINSRDYPTIMGITVIIAIAVLLGNVVTDILYGVLDPKIRQSR